MPKNKYLCIARSPNGKCEPPSPSEMEKMFSAFNAWREKYSDNLIDLGGKLNEGGKVVTADGSTDGPFVEVKEIVGGYMMISADSLDEAVQVVSELPNLASPGSNIEVREIANMG